MTGSSDLELRVYSLSTEESSSEGGSGAGDGGGSSGAGGGDGEVVARLGSKRRPEENESKVSVLWHTMYSRFRVSSSVRKLHTVMGAVSSYCVVGQHPGGCMK